MREAGLDRLRAAATPSDLILDAKARLAAALPKSKARDLLLSMADFFVAAEYRSPLSPSVATRANPAPGVPLAGGQRAPASAWSD